MQTTHSNYYTFIANHLLIVFKINKFHTIKEMCDKDIITD